MWKLSLPWWEFIARAVVVEKHGGRDKVLADQGLSTAEWLPV
jgi:hypothetical protein